MYAAAPVGGCSRAAHPLCEREIARGEEHGELTRLDSPLADADAEDVLRAARGAVSVGRECR